MCATQCSLNALVSPSSFVFVLIEKRDASVCCNATNRQSTKRSANKTFCSETCCGDNRLCVSECKWNSVWHSWRLSRVAHVPHKTITNGNDTAENSVLDFFFVSFSYATMAFTHTHTYASRNFAEMKRLYLSREALCIVWYASHNHLIHRRADLCAFFSSSFFRFILLPTVNIYDLVSLHLMFTTFFVLAARTYILGHSRKMSMKWNGDRY